MLDVEQFKTNGELFNYMLDSKLIKPVNGLNELQIFNLFVKMTNSMGLKLNKEQLFYGLNSNRLIMCSAGAGSGKTTCTNLKVINLTAIQGYNPRRIGFISFSTSSVEDITYNYQRLLNQANMYLRKFNTDERRRNNQELGCDTLPNIRSLNSLTYNIVDQFKDRFGLVSIEIVTAEKSSAIMRSTLNAYREDKIISSYGENAVKWLLDLYDYCNETMLSVIDLANSEKVVKIGVDPKIIQSILDSYRDKLKISNLLHHSDTCKMVVEKAKSDEEFRHILTDIYDVIVVDEYQDISESVYQLLSIMIGKTNMHFAVGDGNQSIYGFKGSRMNNCERFIEEHPDASLCLLTYNRRCREEIIEYANCVLEGIPTRINTKIRHIREGGVVNIHEYSDKFQVLHELVDELKNVPKPRLSEICIGYRKNISCYYLVHLLTEAGVPFRIKDDYMPGNDKLSITIDGLLSLLRSPSNYRIISENLYKVCGINKLMPKPDGRPDEKVPINFEDIMDEYDIEYFYEIPVEALPLRSSAETVKAELEVLEELSRRIKSRGKLSEIIPSLIELMKKNFWDYTSSVMDFPKDLENLVIADYNRDLTYIQFKEYKLQLEENIKRYVDRGYGVQLSTFHSLKGLEYEKVHLIELASGIMPLLSITSEATEDEILENLYEELRLFYVACTRAKDELNVYWDVESPSAFVTINDLYIANKAERKGLLDTNLDKVLSTKIENVDLSSKANTEGLDLDTEDLELDLGIDLGDDAHEGIDLFGDEDTDIDELFDDLLGDGEVDKVFDTKENKDTNHTDIDNSDTGFIDDLRIDTEDKVGSEGGVSKGLSASDLLEKAKSSSARNQEETKADIPEYIAEDIEELEFRTTEGFIDINEGDILANVIKLVCDIVEV